MPLRRHAQRLARRAFVAWHGLQVSGGPFAGLRYPDTTATSLVPKLLGAYERELHGVLEHLRRLPAGRALVVIDCEGCEATLLDPAQVPLLRTATIITELHDWVVPGETITARFTSTHDVTLIPTGGQPPGRSSTLALALSEYRPGPMRWAVMAPLQSPADLA